jgi:hypothetical protein
MRRLDGPRRRDVAVDPADIDEAYLQAPMVQAGPECACVVRTLAFWRYRISRTNAIITDANIRFSLVAQD